MRLPRLRLSWIMIGVTFVALHLMLIKTTMGFLIPQQLVIGGLPMAAILTIGQVVLRTRRDIRLFVVGFEVFGSVALAVYIVLVLFFDRATILPYSELFFKPIKDMFRWHQPVVFFAIVYPVAVAITVLPQVLFAAGGGWLSTRYKIDIARRPRAQGTKRASTN